MLTRKEAQRIFATGIVMIERGDDLQMQVVPYLMAMTGAWNNHPFNFTIFNEAHGAGDRDLCKTELERAIAIAQNTLADVEEGNKHHGT